MTIATKFYNDNADQLFPRYRALNSADVFQDAIDHIPSKPGLVLDIGSGSGRDTKWLAEMGHTVVSVEPSEALQAQAIESGMPANAVYFNSSLPELKGIDQFTGGFDFILCSAVWMHLDQDERRTAIDRIFSLLKSGSEARALITFKVAPEEPGRQMHVLDANQIAKEFCKSGFKYVKTVLNADLLGRDDTRWYTTVLYKDFIPAHLITPIDAVSA